MRQFTIHSDGTPNNTVVVGPDGQKVEGITALSLTLSEAGASSLIMEIAYPVHLQLTIPVTAAIPVFDCPACGDHISHLCDPSGFRDPGR